MKILAEQPDGSVEILDPQPFALELRLQELLEQHPQLVLADLPGDDDRSIWTIGWEVSTDAGSLDLLMLDTTGRLWVVETKLASNSEVKKQVVGQVLGYASSVAEWDSADIERVGSGYLGERAGTEHSGLIDFLSAELGSEARARDLLDTAADRLAEGDLIALIVVDDAPSELRRLVEFVNAHASFELLALKIEILTHYDTRLFIPSVIGAVTATRGSAGSPRRRREWDRSSFLKEWEEKHPETFDVVVDLLEWAEREPELEVSWGSGAVVGSLIVWAWIDQDETDWIPVFGLYTNGRVSPTWRYREKHREADWWAPVIEATAEISDVPQRRGASKEWPVSRLEPDDARLRFKRVTKALIEDARRGSSSGGS